MSRNFPKTFCEARAFANQFYPDGKWFLDITHWSDGDFEIRVIHGLESQTSGENAVREEIVITPHRVYMELNEVVESHRVRTLNKELVSEK